MAEEDIEIVDQVKQKEKPKAPEATILAQRFKTSVDAVLDHYKSLKPTEEKKESIPRFTATPEREELVFKELLRDEEIEYREWIARNPKTGKIEWGFFQRSSAVGSLDAEDSIETKMVKDGENVELTNVYKFPETHPEIISWQLLDASNPEAQMQIKGQLNDVVRTLTPLIPQIPSKAT